MEENKRLKAKLPAAHRKSFIWGGFGTAIGAGVGGYIAAIKGSTIYAGIGAATGFILGILIGLFIGRRISLQSLALGGRIMNVILGVLGLILAIGGILAFFLKQELLGLLGAIFFALCGIYLLIKKDS